MGADTEELDELIGGHVEKGIQINAPEAELLERSLLWLPHRNISFHICLQMQSTHAHIRNAQKESDDDDGVSTSMSMSMSGAMLTMVGKRNRRPNPFSDEVDVAECVAPPLGFCRTRKRTKLPYYILGLAHNWASILCFFIQHSGLLVDVSSTLHTRTGLQINRALTVMSIQISKDIVFFFEYQHHFFFF